MVREAAAIRREERGCGRRTACPVLLTVTLLLATVSFSHAQTVDWSGSVSLKNNYVFSTGTEIDDNPVTQVWLHGRFRNGFFAEIWSSFPLHPDNPNRSAEIDYTVGYVHELNKSELKVSLSYFDIQLPDIFDDLNDFWSPVIRWSTENFFLEATWFHSGDYRDGYRTSIGYTRDLTAGWQANIGLNHANGPFRSRDAIIGKLGVQHYRADRFIEKIGVEISEILYKENSQDPRGFAITFSLTKNLFEK